MIYTFYIEDLYTRTQIVEPRNLKDIESVFERDFNTHGVFFDYTDGTLKLGFSCEARDLLEAAYQSNGEKAYYIFEVEEAANEYVTATNVFSGQIDFSTRFLDLEFFEAEVNSSNKELKFKNRKSKVINLNSGQDLDGNNVANVNYDQSIRLLGAKPRAQLSLTKQTEQAEVTRSVDGYTYYTVGLQNLTSTEISKFKPKRNYGYQGDGIVNNLYFDPSGKEFLDVERDVDLQISITWDIDATFTNVSGTPATYSMQLEFWTLPEFADETNAKDVQIIIDSAIGTNLSGSDNYYISIKAGTKVALICTIYSTNSSEVIDTEMTVNTLSLDITDVRVSKGQLTQWYRLHDALNKNLAFLTGKHDFLYSELLGHTTNGYTSNGCLANMFITNGFRIRSITDTKKAPSFSFDDFIENLNAHQAVGYGFEVIESPIELGYYNIDWISSTSGTGTIRINENIESTITVGSLLGFYDNEFIYGVYEVTASSWGGAYTEIEIDISENNNYYDGTYSENPNPNTYTVYLTCNSSTEYRERMRVEHWEHFYSDSELIDLGVVEDYNEEPLEDVYNEIKFEFNKYANDEKQPLTLEDFHTKASWSIPIEKTDKTKMLKMSWIGSTGLITESKLNTESVSPTTSNKLDDDLFFCDKIAKHITEEVTFDASNGCIKVNDYVYDNYIYGATHFSVSGSVSNDDTFTIVGDPLFSIDTEEYCIYVAQTLTDETVSVTITPVYDGLKEYKPESMENITSQTGLTVPNYMYNVRRTIKRMLLRWGSFIKSIVSYNPFIGTLKNLTYVNNGDLVTQLDTTNLTGCYIDSGVLTENDKLDVSDLQAPKFKPNIINFTKKVCDTDYEMIKDAHRNSLVYPEMNYGYITITNRKGESKTGWLLNMKRSPIDRITKIKMIERYV